MIICLKLISKYSLFPKNKTAVNEGALKIILHFKKIKRGKLSGSEGRRRSRNLEPVGGASACQSQANREAE